MSELYELGPDLMRDSSTHQVVEGPQNSASEKADIHSTFYAPAKAELPAECRSMNRMDSMMGPSMFSAVRIRVGRSASSRR